MEVLAVKGEVNLCQPCRGTAVSHLFPIHVLRKAVWLSLGFYSFTEIAHDESDEQQTCLIWSRP